MLDNMVDWHEAKRIEKLMPGAHVEIFVDGHDTLLRQPENHVERLAAYFRDVLHQDVYQGRYKVAFP